MTTWQATITVPSAISATRTGTATIQAAIALTYQPLANRLAFPASNGKFISAQLGLQDTGSGLQFFRSVVLCTNASCSTSDGSTSIVYGNGSGSSALAAGQPASYATSYTFTLSLNESTSVFSYSISDGELGTWTSTADASALFNAHNVDPAADFLSALLRVRAYDAGTAGGSSGTMLARFNNVYRTTPSSAFALYDDFHGGTIDPTLWNTGEGAVRMNGGGLELRPGVTSSTTVAASSSVGVTPDSIPATANQIKVDVDWRSPEPEPAAAHCLRKGTV